MTPSIEDRLISILHGLRNVIFPAIDPAEALAFEQSGLILAQLSMLVQQIPYADRYYRLCRDDARAVAAALIEAPEGGPQSCAAAASLAVLLQEPGNDPHADYLAIAAGIEALTSAAFTDGEPGWRGRVDGTLLGFVSRQNRRERVWFKDAGFDPASGELPDLATLCSASGDQRDSR